MFGFGKKKKKEEDVTLVTPEQMAGLLSYMANSSTFDVMEGKGVSLNDLGLDKINQVYYELMILNMFILINLVSQWLNDECLRNGILDGMHSLYYTHLKENLNKTDEDLKVFRKYHSERYEQYRTIIETSNDKDWLRDLAKAALNNLHDEVYDDLTALMAMNSYISAQYQFTPIMLNKYKLKV